MDHARHITTHQITPTPSQIIRLEPIVAHVVGGGTSGVVLRGDHHVQHGVRVSLDARDTSGDPSAELSLTSVTSVSL
jgi:hypothetical protein